MIPDRIFEHLSNMTPEDLELIGDLTDLIAIRPRLAEGMPAHIREDKAHRYMASVLEFARQVCGEETVQEAYGSVATDRAEALQGFAVRAQLASYVFGRHDVGPGSLNEAAAEARAVAQGDKPQVFAKLGRRRPIRLLRAKYEALRWDAWLNGLGIGVDARHTAIANAFGAPWDTISRWRPDVEAAWGREAVRQLEMDRIDATRGLRMRTMRPGEPWETGLLRAGARYVAALRER